MILGLTTFLIGAAVFLLQEGGSVHFDFSISLGQVVLAATLVGGFMKLYGPLMQRTWEHDLMWEDYASAHGISSEDKPSRSLWEKGKGAGA